jgi:hypothetical protein
MAGARMFGLVIAFLQTNCALGVMPSLFQGKRVKIPHHVLSKDGRNLGSGPLLSSRFEIQLLDLLTKGLLFSVQGSA